MRNMSCSLTTPQVRARTKTVTRRLGWLDLRVGDRLQLCEKCMGRRNGEPLVKLAVVEVLAVRREKLERMLANRVYGQKECRREGFPDKTPAQFVRFFCETHDLIDKRGKEKRGAVVTRIEWKFVDA